MNEQYIKVLLDYQHFAQNKRLADVIQKSYPDFDERDDDRLSFMTEGQVEQLAAAGVDNGNTSKNNRQSFIKSLGGLLILTSLCFFSCKPETETETKYIDQTDIKTTLYTNADATQIAYYTQHYFTDANGDYFIKELSEDYDWAETEQKEVPAGTLIEGLGKEIEGFEQSGFTQSGKTISLFYRAKLVTYRFFLNEGDSTPVTTLAGRAKLPLTTPSTKNYSSDGKFALWKTTDGSVLERTYGTENLDFYAHWFTPLGTKEKPDTVGDIVFSDGTAIHYADADLTAAQKKNAIAVVVSTTYSRVTGHGAGYNEGNHLIALGTLAYEGQWYTDGVYDTVTSYTDGRFSTAVITAKSGYSDEKFPVFSWAKQYARKLMQERSITLKDEFLTDWYIPSFYEWQQAIISGSVVKAAFDKIGFDADILTTVYWTSSSVMGLLTGASTASWYVRVSTDNLLPHTETYNALAMREFK